MHGQNNRGRRKIYGMTICRVNQAALANYRDHAVHGRVVVIDTETTGISQDDEVVQIAAVEYTTGIRTRMLNLYVVPTCPIDPKAEAVNHLSREFLEANGVSPVAALDRFYAFLGRKALVVGHNIHFDLRMLRGECAKFGFHAEPDALTYCDTIALAKRLVPGLPHYRLGMLLAELGLEGKNTHNALDDTLACGTLFFDLVRRIPTPGEYTYEPIPE